MTRPTPARLAALTAVLTLTLTGCGSHGAPSTTATTRTVPSFAAATARDIRLTDGWVSAAGDMGDMPGSTMSPGMKMSSGSMSGMDMSGDGGKAEATAYATLTETGTSGDFLVSVSTPAAAKVTLHRTVTSSNGSAGTMVGVSDIAVPAGGHVALAPGGYHVMLEGLRTTLKVGARITMTWTFRSGATLTTSFPVINPADRPQSGQ